MKIGILSDSHDNIIKLKKAVKYFNHSDVKFVLHAGDYIAPFSVIILNRLRVPYKGVFGNNDGEKKGLSQISQGKISEGPLKILLNGKRVLMYHAKPNIDKLIKENAADLIIYGHNHRFESKKQGNALVLNPGECGGWLYGKSTIAVVDLEKMKVKKIKI